ncbi:hypothetical protein BJ917_5248 [Pseudomonas sp. WPR_5_2]|uniref:hypothetical protein n=1 Tax=Pseudomonas sp. WPR_5_2 TaxID=1907371 RepID=UPI000EB3B932|nr:hypothetical protein [Pseudomonas sp. WPR_5_2]RKS17093.1 hypothetical protein BJ917_5248 [Pseudomonas sp. WPR_5_2]
MPIKTTQKLEDLEMLFAFEGWAEPRGFNLTRSENTQYDHIETRSAWLGFEAAHGPDGCRPTGQQLYALIKKNSDYAHQTNKLFPVRVSQAPYDDYVVHGGPGGVYRMRDVNFYVIEDGKQYRLN